MSKQANPQPVTPEQYLADELLREVRHEYLGGYVYAMSGASGHHNVISGNLYIALTQHYRPQGCRVYQEGMKAKLNWGGHTYFYYPDVMLCCDAKDDPAEYFCTSPCLLVEVLSSATARYDRQEKFHAYRQIASLQTYVLVDQKHMHLTLHRRANDWQAEIFTEPTDAIQLGCGPEHPALTMTLAQIYETVL